MKVKLIGRKLYLPKEIIEKAALSENEVCEATVVGDEVRIRRELPKELNMAKILRREGVSVPIDKMAMAEDVEDV